MIAVIVAQDNNGVIGNRNELPWYLPNDLKRFKDLTTGHTVIMGRNTYESIVARLGHALPNRRNIVISSKLEPEDDIEVVRSLDEALDLVEPDEDAFIIGGERVYQEGLERAERLYLTQVDAEVDGDVHLPDLDPAEWRTLGSQDNPADERHPYPYQFITLERAA